MFFRKRTATDTGSPHPYSPLAVLTGRPPIFVTAVVYDDFLGIARTFAKRFGNVDAGFLVTLTHSIEYPGKASALAASASEHKRRHPKHRIIYLCNTERETNLICLAGQPAILLNQNCYVSEDIFRPLPNTEPEFDAVYNATFTPLKRHELGGKINRLAYVSYPLGDASSLEIQRRILAHLVNSYPGHALLNPAKDGLPIRMSSTETNAAINRASVGVCLSAIEGANFATMEYMLAGLPVVSTPSIGGRDYFFDPEYCTVCPAEADAVRDAVEEMKARRLPRDYVRMRTLEKIRKERKRFFSLVNEMLATLGSSRRFGEEWPFGNVSGMLVWAALEDHLDEFQRRLAEGRQPIAPGKK